MENEEQEKKDKKSNVQIFSVVKDKYDFTFLPTIECLGQG
jgi:hypothetical protein